ncbi:hypothetical protein L1887_43448 [Cichorium endivia]|nr:hypothetical protein L1887_43448 [Cichorium endivia]
MALKDGTTTRFVGGIIGKRSCRSEQGRDERCLDVDVARRAFCACTVARASRVEGILSAKPADVDGACSAHLHFERGGVGDLGVLDDLDALLVRTEDE